MAKKELGHLAKQRQALSQALQKGTITPSLEHETDMVRLSSILQKSLPGANVSIRSNAILPGGYQQVFAIEQIKQLQSILKGGQAIKEMKITFQVNSLKEDDFQPQFRVDLLYFL